MNQHSQLRTVAVIVMGCMLGAGLYGCGSQEGDVKTDLAQLTSGLKGKIAPLPAIKPYTPYAYTATDQPDPFGAAKTQLVTKNASSASQAPDMHRIKEPLEAFPIDVMKYSGTIIQRGVVHALVTVEGNMYTVRLGDHLGTNFGKVSKITEDEIGLREIVQDASGEWIERNNSVTPLQGK